MGGSAGHLASMAKAPHRERCDDSGAREGCAGRFGGSNIRTSLPCDDSGAREGCAGRFGGSNIRTSLPCHLLLTIVVCGGATSRIFVLDAQSRTDTQTQQRVCGTGSGGWVSRIFHTNFCFRYSLCVPCLACLLTLFNSFVPGRLRYAAAWPSAASAPRPNKSRTALDDNTNS